MRNLWKEAGKKRVWQQLWMVSYGENTLNGVNQQGTRDSLQKHFPKTSFPRFKENSNLRSKLQSHHTGAG